MAINGHKDHITKIIGVLLKILLASFLRMFNYIKEIESNKSQNLRDNSISLAINFQNLKITRKIAHRTIQLELKNP